MTRGEFLSKGWWARLILAAVLIPILTAGFTTDPITVWPGEGVQPVIPCASGGWPRC